MITSIYVIVICTGVGLIANRDIEDGEYVSDSEDYQFAFQTNTLDSGECISWHENRRRERLLCSQRLLQKIQLGWNLHE